MIEWRKTVLRKDKIDKLIGWLETEEIVLVDNERLGENVKIAGSEVRPEHLHDGLIEEQFNEDEIKELEKFLKKVELVLVYIPDITGVSIDGCIFDTDNLHTSRLWESLDKS